jgi:hypothetical protein
MSRRATTWVAWGLWAVNVVVVVAMIVRGDGSGSGTGGELGGAVFITVFATTGALVASRVPRNPVGWLLCSGALAFTVGGISVTISELALRDGWHGPVVTSAAWVGTFVWMLGVGPAATFVLLLFPDGRLPSRRWRPIAWLAGAALAVITIGIALAPGRIEDTNVTNPIGVLALADELAVVESAGLVALFACILASCASLVVRYRRSGPEQRQQLKWLAWSLPLVLTWLFSSIVVEMWLGGDAGADVSNLLLAIGLSVVPVAIAIAILRHRLYDIDLVIKRTLVYGALTATLLVTYLALVLVLQVGLSPVTSTSDLAVAGSTLAVAALFRPLRARIQAGVDRRFFRSRYDAVRTLDAFAGQLRQEVDLESVRTDLRRVVSETVQPAHISIWLRGTP